MKEKKRRERNTLHDFQMTTSSSSSTTSSTTTQQENLVPKFWKGPLLFKTFLVPNSIHFNFRSTVFHLQTNTNVKLETIGINFTRPTKQISSKIEDGFVVSSLNFWPTK